MFIDVRLVPPSLRSDDLLLDVRGMWKGPRVEHQAMQQTLMLLCLVCNVMAEIATDDHDQLKQCIPHGLLANKSLKEQMVTRHNATSRWLGSNAPKWRRDSNDEFFRE